MMNNSARFTIRDLLVLVAFTGLGLAFTIHALKNHSEYNDIVYGGIGDTYSVRSIVEFIDRKSILIAPIIAFWTIALLLIRFMRRVRRADILAERSLMFNLSATTVISLAIVECLLMYLSSASITFTPLYLIGAYKEHVGVTVAAAWVLIMAGGRWKCDSNWMDRASLGVALFWILQPALGLTTLLVICIRSLTGR